MNKNRLLIIWRFIVLCWATLTPVIVFWEWNQGSLIVINILIGSVLFLLVSRLIFRRLILCAPDHVSWKHLSAERILLALCAMTLIGTHIHASRSEVMMAHCQYTARIAGAMFEANQLGIKKESVLVRFNELPEEMFFRVVAWVADEAYAHPKYRLNLTRKLMQDRFQDRMLFACIARNG